MLASTVQVDMGVTLTIEPGVLVYSNSGARLEVFGRVNATGNPADYITFNKVSIINGTSAYPSIYLDYTKLIDMTAYSTGSITLRNSIVGNKSAKYAGFQVIINNMKADCLIENNVIFNNPGIRISGTGYVLTIRNNDLINIRIDIDSGSSNNNIVVNNNFYHSGISLFDSANVTVINNYWDPIMIYDHNDNLNSLNTAIYQPTLNYPVVTNNDITQYL
jgi:hypothetical protein